MILKIFLSFLLSICFIFFIFYYFPVKEGASLLEEIYPWQVFLSSNTLAQGDTLAIRIKTEKDFKEITATFGDEQVPFSKLQNGDWLGITGASVKKEPGKYKLSVNLGDEVFGKNIAVTERNFPITELAVTKELEEKGYTPSNISQNIAQKDNVSIYDVFKIYTPTAFFNKPFIFPLKKIEVVGLFGSIRKSNDITLQHLGVDLEADEDTPVYAVNDGRVVFSEELIDYGKTIIIDHGLGIYSLYLHLNKYKFTKGQNVKEGDVIGLSGNTGYSIAPHLHFSIKISRPDVFLSIDPLKFLKSTQFMDNE